MYYVHYSIKTVIIAYTYFLDLMKAYQPRTSTFVDIFSSGWKTKSCHITRLNAMIVFYQKRIKFLKKNIFIKDIAIWNRRVTGMVFLPGFRAVASLQGPKERSRNGIISLIGEYWKNVELPSQNMNFKITYKRKKC